MRKFRVFQGGRHRRRKFLSKRDLRFATWAFFAVLATGIAVTNVPATSLPAVSLPSSSTPSVSLRVIDGDTVEVRTTGEVIRLPNIDTPETGGRAQCAAERSAGDAATRAATQFIASANSITINRTDRQDRYGRTIGFVLIDGRDLGEAMIADGHARPWRGRREPWCASDGTLLR
jgi:endonuclease YncB( thermonuclease family)